MRLSNLWEWFFSLFSKKKPLLLSPVSAPNNLDRVFLETTIKVEKERARREEQREEEARQKAEAIAKRRNEILSSVYFERGMRALVKAVHDTGSTLISMNDCGFSSPTEWDIFKEQFIQVLEKKSIKIAWDTMKDYPHHLWVNSDSVKKYYEKCKKEAKARPETIQEGPYR